VFQKRALQDEKELNRMWGDINGTMFGPVTHTCFTGPRNWAGKRSDSMSLGSKMLNSEFIRSKGAGVLEVQTFIPPPADLKPPSTATPFVYSDD